MRVNGKRVLLCTCESTMPLNADAIARALGTDPPKTVWRMLCQDQVEGFRAVLEDDDDGPVLVCCTHQAPLFEELAAEIDAGTGKAPALSFVDIRETAGWSDQAAAATAKIAALINEAAADVRATPSLELTSEGSVIVLGDGETAMEVAQRLAAEGRAVTCVLTARAEAVPPPSIRRFPVLRGRLERVSGHLGAFSVVLADAAALSPSSRGVARFSPAGGEARLEADLILDLRGDLRGAPALFPAGRDGYLRAEPSDVLGVERALGQALSLVGVFEKPRYLRVDPDVCAHGRNSKTGCTRCLDVCPTGSILSAGDHVTVTLATCDGHGGCAAVCPTGAIQYDLPAGNALFQRLRTLVRTAVQAGQAPVLLVHDTRHGRRMIEALAHHGPGLPARVVPMALHSAEVVGAPFLLTAMAYGAAGVVVLTDPAASDGAGAQHEAAALVARIFSGLGYGHEPPVTVTAEGDPWSLRTLLDGLDARTVVPPATFTPVGTPRAIAAQALKHLHGQAPSPVDRLPLEAGAPYGAITVDNARCTLCLSCVGACPTQAIGDSPDKPLLSFQESACVQCGLCRVTCPESAIALVPRLTFGEAAEARVVVKEEEPFHCVRCGKAFGTRSSIERILDRLGGHAMFQDSGKLDLIKMCEDCRVIVQFETGSEAFGGPLGAGVRSGPRTTEDYLREREELGKKSH